MENKASLDEAFVLLRVLVADSGSSVNDGLTALLSEIDGISVFGCAQEEGKILALARSLRPDVVILDIQRTEQVSFALLARLKAWTDPPVVIVLCEGEILPLRTEILAKGADYILVRTDCDELIRLLAGLKRGRSLSC